MTQFLSSIADTGILPWMVLFIAGGIVLREAWRVSDDVFWGDGFADELED